MSHDQFEQAGFRLEFYPMDQPCHGFLTFTGYEKAFDSIETNTARSTPAEGNRSQTKSSPNCCRNCSINTPPFHRPLTVPIERGIRQGDIILNIITETNLYMYLGRCEQGSQHKGRNRNESSRDSIETRQRSHRPSTGSKTSHSPFQPNKWTALPALCYVLETWDDTTTTSRTVQHPPSAWTMFFDIQTVLTTSSRNTLLKSSKHTSSSRSKKKQTNSEAHTVGYIIRRNAKWTKRTVE